MIKRNIFFLLFFLTLNNFIYCDRNLPERNCFFSSLNRFSEINDIIGSITWPLYTIKNIYWNIKDITDRIKENNYVKNYNKKKEELFKKYYCSIGNFENCTKNIEMLNVSLKNIIGQEEAVNSIREIMISIIEKYYEFDFFKKKKDNDLKTGLENLKNELIKKNTKKSEINKRLNEYKELFKYENSQYLNQGPGCTFLYFVGPAGTGKTETAMQLVKSLTLSCNPAYIIDAASILMHNGKFSNLLKPVNMNSKNENPKTDTFLRSDLDTYIRTAKRGVIIFNEIDKILKDPSLAPNLNETLRGFKDNNFYVDEKGNKIDLSGFVIIFTSNEKIDASEKDTTGSRTNVNSDESLRTRFRIIKFHEFNIDEYNKLINIYLMKVKSSFEDMYKDINLTINFEPEIEKYCSYYIYNNQELKNRGARAIYDVLGDSLKSNIFIFAETIKSRNENKSQTIFVSFDDITNKFVVTDNGFIDHKLIDKKLNRVNRKSSSIKKNIVIIFLVLLAIYFLIFTFTKLVIRKKF